MKTAEEIFKLLEVVKDPEIPVLAITDLGIITGVHPMAEYVRIDITPTFVGCPALDLIKAEIISVLRTNGIPAQVKVDYSDPWSSERITDRGRAVLKDFGLAPPSRSPLIDDISILEHVECPRCGSQNTELNNVFGPTLCRSIHRCNQCQETFEHFKPV